MMTGEEHEEGREVGQVASLARERVARPERRNPSTNRLHLYSEGKGAVEVSGRGEAVRFVC